MASTRSRLEPHLTRLIVALFVLFITLQAAVVLSIFIRVPSATSAARPGALPSAWTSLFERIFGSMPGASPLFIAVLGLVAVAGGGSIVLLAWRARRRQVLSVRGEKAMVGEKEALMVGDAEKYEE